MKSYRANRRGALPWLLAVFIVAPLASIPFLEGGVWARTLSLAVLWVPAALLGWIFLSTGYRIERGHLIYRSAFLRGRIPVHGISEIVSGTTLWVGTKPALARNGMIIQYNGYQQVYIAPESNQEMIAHLLELNPRIRVTDKGGATPPLPDPPPVERRDAAAPGSASRRSPNPLE